MEEITLVYSEDLLKAAVRLFWWCSIGPFFLLLLLAMLAGTVFFILEGNRTWLVGVMGSVVLMGFLFSLVLYITHYRNTLGKFRLLRGTSTKFKICEDGFEVESINGKASVNWSNVTELWQFQDYWLIFISQAQFITLPLSCISIDHQNSIAGHIKTAGGKIA